MSSHRNGVRWVIWIFCGAFTAAAAVSSIIGLTIGPPEFLLLSVIVAFPTMGLIFLLIFHSIHIDRKMWLNAWENAAAELSATTHDKIPLEWDKRLRSQSMYRFPVRIAKALTGCFDQYDYLLLSRVQSDGDSAFDAFAIFIVLQNSRETAFSLQRRSYWRWLAKDNFVYDVALKGSHERENMSHLFALRSAHEDNETLLRLVEDVFVPQFRNLRDWRFACDKGLLCAWPPMPKSESTATVEDVTTRQILSMVKLGLEIAASIDQFAKVVNTAASS